MKEKIEQEKEIKKLDVKKIPTSISNNLITILSLKKDLMITINCCNELLKIKKTTILQ